MATPAPIALEQARILYRQAPAGVLFSGGAACLVATVFAMNGRIAPWAAGVWMAMMVACVVFHLWLCLGFARARDPDPRTWTSRFVVASGLEGLTWCVGPFLLTDGAHYDQLLISALLSTAMASGAAYVFSTDLRAFRVFFYPVMAPYVVLFAIYPFPLHLLIEVMVWIYLIGMPTVAVNAHRQLMESLRLRFENQALAEDLRRQKELADEANVAKSRFLASASHDLRQPIHAIGLFIGAMRPRRMDAEARRLLGFIAGSVESMDNLFAALLDISKLDAGAIQPKFQSVEIGPLLARIARDYAPEASQKGLEFRVMPCSLLVRSDPVLLELALRNMLANAVRHTVRGRVVVGVRRGGSRHGALRVEVHDTGPGIAASEQERVFQEFYQINNPERDRTKGLGLGLAILRRIAVLLDTPLTLVSGAGRGSCFALALQVANAPPEAPEAPDTSVAQPGGGQILVVDDEAGVRAAMQSLLTSWGYEAVVAGSLAEMLELVAGQAAPPQLLICDYRLRDGDDGLTVIAGLRARFQCDLPAMLVTGDTAPDRISSARASGFVLLYKPLPSGKLRAAIANLIRAARPVEPAALP